MLAPELTDSQAQIVSALVLDAMAAAGRRAEAEEQLRAALDPAVVQLAALRYRAR